MAGLGGAGWPEIRAGVRDAWVVGLGLIPLGMAFGSVSYTHLTLPTTPYV